MAVLLSDDFNRADSATDPGSPAVGGPYTVRSGTAGISGNRLYFPVISGTGAGSHLTFPAASDVDISVTFPLAPTSTSQGIFFRWQDVNNLWMVRINNANVAINRMQAGALTSYVTASGTYTHAAGDVLRVVALGRNIYVYLNGALRLWYEDIRYNPAYTIAGVTLLGTTQRLDDLLAVDATASTLDAVVHETVTTASDPVVTASLVYKGRDTKTLDEGNEA